eukprot:TRINITY_DN4418_c0_g1_i1.p1 TRINITY_DN4418_c0_g1~~TRINITY_DN4418_c0_g1_i1.p1  ORF type:complete len:124 (+),score=10.15 TRINITY_DN4418_c0_g1_i1:223-594(+)
MKVVGNRNNYGSIQNKYSNRENSDILDSKQIKQMRKLRAADSIDIVEVYHAMLDTAEKDLLDSYVELYKVFRIKHKEKESNRKLIVNNLNYKIKSLPLIYPHLLYYGSQKEFTFRRLQKVNFI